MGNNPASVTVLTDGSRAYTANQTDQTVTIVNLTSHTVEKTLPVIGYPRTVVSTQNSQFGKVYVASPNSPYITIIRTDLDIVDTTVLVLGDVVDVRVTSPERFQRQQQRNQPQSRLRPALQPAANSARDPVTRSLNARHSRNSFSEFCNRIDNWRAILHGRNGSLAFFAGVSNDRGKLKRRLIFEVIPNTDRPGPTRQPLIE